MKKNLKGCVERIEVGEAQVLIDMNRYDVIEAAGMTPDLRHKKSAHMSAAWRFSERSRVSVRMNGGDLSDFRYLTFSTFAVGGVGGSFSLQFCNVGEALSGYECTLPITRDGWNDYRVELPFLRAMGTPLGWDRIATVALDSVAGGQANHAETVLYFDNFYVWEDAAPPLYASMPELKGAAVFSRTGNYAIVDRKRICNTADGAIAKPFERDGVLWVPMAPVAAGIAHSAVVDNRAFTLAFTYRRKKYFFSADSDRMQVGGEEVALGFYPAVLGGTLFFPITFVRDFFHWRQIFIDPMGLIVLSNRKNVFESARDAQVIWGLIADCTFFRPTAERVLGDLHRNFPNPARGRLLASFDELMQLRRDAKTDPALRGYVDLLRADYGTKSARFAATPLAGEINADALNEAADALIAFAMLYRVTGDKAYAERTALEAEALAALADWKGGRTMETVGRVSLGMAIGYDWCRHVWSEGRKALVERAMLRNAIRPALDTYDGKGTMWFAGSAAAATANAGMLALALALADVYPQSALKLTDRILRNIEPCFASLAPDGGCAESMEAWERSSRALALSVAMLERACGDDYGLASAPGFSSTVYFPIHVGSAAGAWNFHGSAAGAADTSMAFCFAKRSGDVIPAWMRRQQILSGQKTVHPFDILFYVPIDDTMVPQLPLDAVWRRAGLATMRSGWDSAASFVGLHGGSNHEINGDLDAGSVILDMEGERFFTEVTRADAMPGLLCRRAAGQNTVCIDPAEEPAPDQNPDAVATLTEMRSSPERAYAIVDMTGTSDALLRAKRGVMLTENRTVAVIQDELTLSHPADVVWTVWTRAEASTTPSGRSLKLVQNGKTLLCRLAGVGAPARFELTRYEESGLTAVTVRVSGREKLRMAVVCRSFAEDDAISKKAYELVPMSRWGEI